MVDQPAPPGSNEHSPTDDHGWDWNYAAVQRWLARAEAGSVLLVCSDAAGPGGTRSVPVVALPACVADLPSYRVADFAAVVDTVGIADCPHRTQVEGWLAGLPGPLRHRVHRADAPPRGRILAEVRRPPVDRRGLFGLPRSGPEVFEHEADTPDRQRLVTSLRRLGGQAGSRSDEGQQPPGLLLSATGCTTCGVCVKACPSGALSLTGDDVRTLHHDRSACAGTGSCVELCPESALSGTDRPDWSTVINLPRAELATVLTRVCSRCRDRFAGSDDVCPACRQWLDNPFSVHLPPGAAEQLRRYRADRRLSGD